MNVKALHDALVRALANGIDPLSEVVIDVGYHDDAEQWDTAGNWHTLDEVKDPSDKESAEFIDYGNGDTEQGYIWLTLIPGEGADERNTRAHYIGEPETVG